jgi:hypothetical protein
MSLQPTVHNQSSTYFFNPQELARLAVYRAAVVARFYTDQCDLASMRNGIDAVGLFDAVRLEQQRAS